ncbi:MAG: hypothetical protein FE78DRAFT_87360 [Acidomyces sp. 'richmondensis']|nr:MAG: hypothetical protein FE78DRAFT_87360 [Acidomyces sp. 'richmondensis']
MTGPASTSRTSSFVSTGTTSSQNAALLGAIKAFGKPPPKAGPPSNTHESPNGALTAATNAGIAGKTPNPASNQRPPSPGRVPSPAASSMESIRGSGTQAQSIPKGKNTSDLAKPGIDSEEQPKSPSHQAACLAVARSPDSQTGSSPIQPRAKTVQKPSVAPKPRRLSEHFKPTDTNRPDLSPIQLTTSLVQLFESRSTGNVKTEQKRPGPVVAKPSQDLPIKSPQPLRKSDGAITSVFQMDLEEPEHEAKPPPTIEVKDHDPDLQLRSTPTSEEDYVSASEDTATIGSPGNIDRAGERHICAPSISAVASTSLRSQREPIRHSSSPMKSSSVQPIQIPRRTPGPLKSPPAELSKSPKPAPSITAQYHQMYPRRMTPLNTGDDLANAIVASNLASRSSSPRKVDPPPLPTRRRKHHHTLSFSRTPSPAKTGMLHTLRNLETEESDGEEDLHPYSKHHKKRLVRKHPNKHHEGDRKRWRDAVTERERKRYEGVWAANKGLYISSPISESATSQTTPQSQDAGVVNSQAADQVSNLVVRDIWARSRLPETVLEDIWDLVDEDQVGRLSKEQFVVGMWLIDQRLKGRKLPVKVSPTVWASVRGLQGIKIRK